MLKARVCKTLGLSARSGSPAGHLPGDEQLAPSCDGGFSGASLPVSERLCNFVPASYVMHRACVPGTWLCLVSERARLELQGHVPAGTGVGQLAEHWWLVGVCVQGGVSTRRDSSVLTTCNLELTMHQSLRSFVKSIGLGFKTPIEAKEGQYIDKKCPWAGNVSIRGKLLRGIVVSTKMKRTVVIRRDYL